MKMKSFLWSQSASLEEGDIFIIDGNVSRYKRESIQNEAMSFMNSKDFKQIDRHKEGSPTTMSYRISENMDAIQLAGNYSEKDECGRPLVYVLSIKSKSEDEVLDTLIDYSKQIGCTLHEEDLKSFQSFFRKKRQRGILRRFLCLGLIIFSIAIVIIAIINHYNN